MPILISSEEGMHVCINLLVLISCISRSSLLKSLDLLAKLVKLEYGKYIILSFDIEVRLKSAQLFLHYILPTTC